MNLGFDCGYAVFLPQDYLDSKQELLNTLSRLNEQDLAENRTLPKQNIASRHIDEGSSQAR
ncbi:MAG: hypothetical protein MHPSP_002288, partial [Paramarteilia canceri]